MKELVRNEMQHSFQDQLNELVEELRYDEFVSVVLSYKCTSVPCFHRQEYEAKGETKSDRELMREVVSVNRLVSVLRDRANPSPSTIAFQHLVKLPFSVMNASKPGLLYRGP